MLYDMLVEVAEQYPQKNAIETESSQISYATLLDQVDCFAANLASLGVRLNDPVVVLLPNGVEFIISVFATAKLGAIVVPLNTALASTELAFYLEDSEPGILISTDGVVSQHNELIQKHTQNCHVVTQVPLTQQNRDNESASFCTVFPETTALYQYSSGSTGVPKRVMRTHANLVHEANSFKVTAAVTSEDRILCVVPMFHAHGFGNCLLATICAGATLLISPPFNRDAVMAALTEKGVTIFPGVPFLFSVLVDSTSVAAVKLTKLRLAFTAGAALSQTIFTGFNDKFGVQLRQLYGSTETGSIAINLGTTTGGLWASVGKPIHKIEVDIVSEEGQLLPPNETGEIVVRSEAMTAGYAGLDEVNQKTFRDNCFWSGDLGRLDTDGNLFITGRKKLFINVGGNKVDPSEVEAVLNTHSAIQESVVLGVPGAYGDEVVKAVLVLNEKLEPAEVQEWLRGKVADFKVPRIVEFCREIPRSPLGKILRKNLQESLPREQLS